MGQSNKGQLKEENKLNLCFAKRLEKQVLIVQLHKLLKVITEMLDAWSNIFFGQEK